MKGWTKDGHEVELFPWQETMVRMLLSPYRIVICPRPRGFGWSTVLATAARLDAENRAIAPPSPADAAQAKRAGTSLGLEISTPT